MTRKAVLKEIVMQDRMQMSRLAVAIASLLWGLQLSLGGHAPATNYLELIAPGEVWGAAFLLHFVLGVYTLLSQSRGKIALLGDGVLGGLLWTLSTASCGISYWDWSLPFVEALTHYKWASGMPATLVISVIAWWNMVRLWADDGIPPSNRTNME